MPLERPHILISQPGRSVEYAAKTGGGDKSEPRPVLNRAANAARVVREAVRAVEASQAAAKDDFAYDLARLPLSVRATTEWGVNRTAPASAELLSLVGTGEDARANLAIAPANLARLERAADKYAAWDPETSKRKPQHFNFFEAAPKIGVTTVVDLWASHLDIPKDGDQALWELWLKPERETSVRALIRRLGLRSFEADALNFETARVLPVEATREDMERLAHSASIAQLRPASTLNTGLVNMTAAIQGAAVTAAVSRLTPANDGAPSVCLLDTGVFDHPLLVGSIKAKLVVGGEYTPNDYDGHGTKMAGLALFSDLPDLMIGGPATPAVHLESVAIQPPPGMAATPALPAARVRAAVRAIELARESRRSFCFAMNAVEDASDGSPSSLSTELDRLAFNPDAPDRPRLFFAAAGNLADVITHAAYPASNDLGGIQTPAQAWNLLTVGACTELEADLTPMEPLAPHGDLSPWSRTAVGWSQAAKPPSKPDVVFEGGNQPFDPVTLDVGSHSDLLLLTTSNDPANPLALTGQTSAATAAAAGFSARLQAEYPGFWDETIRGLFVHSAEHSPAMEARVAGYSAIGGQRKSQLLRRYGYGRTNKDRALENARNSLTLIHQGTLAPYRLNEAGKVVLGEMRVHSLPWPIEILTELGDEQAELRVTVSYFVEPNVGEAQVGNFQDYPSHGIDFTVRKHNETDDQMMARISRSVVTDEAAASRGPSGWAFGRQYRGRGGLRHDRWTGSASQLAAMGGIVVFPGSGWWRNDLERVGDLVRYSLIVSIRTREEEIYSAIPIEIPA